MSQHSPDSAAYESRIKELSDLAQSLRDRIQELLADNHALWRMNEELAARQGAFEQALIPFIENAVRRIVDDRLESTLREND